MEQRGHRRIVMKKPHYLVRTKCGFVLQDNKIHQEIKYTKVLAQAKRFSLDDALSMAVRVKGEIATVAEWKVQNWN